MGRALVVFYGNPVRERDDMRFDYFYARPSPGERLIAYKLVCIKDYNCQLPNEPLGTLVEGREIKLSGRLSRAVYSYTLESIAPESRKIIERKLRQTIEPDKDEVCK